MNKLKDDYLVNHIAMDILTIASVSYTHLHVQ